MNATQNRTEQKRQDANAVLQDEIVVLCGVPKITLRVHHGLGDEDDEQWSAEG
jgi:hypothetical protein